jgi:hypothetical protein
MSAGETDGQGLRDAATVLPFVATVLLMPPVVLIFAAPVMAFGIPLIVVYVFAVWLVVIAAAGLTARRLARLDAAPRPAAERREE